MPQHMYKVAEGKHQLADGSFVRASDPAFPLDPEEAAKFPGKFVLQLTPATKEDVAEADAEADAAKKKAAAEAAEKAKKTTAPAK